jgi:hypothetical protein
MAGRGSARTTSGIVVGLVGLGLAGLGLAARREVGQALARERIFLGPGTKPVTSAAAARSLAETIRSSTLGSTGGLAYSEVQPYLDASGSPTADEESAARDGNGRPVENPDVRLWLQAMTLQTALMQAFLAFRLAELTAGLGGVLVAVGAGLAATGDGDRA